MRLSVLSLGRFDRLGFCQMVNNRKMSKVEAKIISVDRKGRFIALSVKAKDEQEERDAVKDHQRQESERVGPATLGELIKAQMDSPSEET